MFPLLVLWFGIALPLVFLEAYFAVRRDLVELPLQAPLFHINVQNKSSCRPQRFWVLSVTLCLLSCARGFVLHHVFPEAHQFYCLFDLLTVVIAIIEFPDLHGVPRTEPSAPLLCRCCSGALHRVQRTKHSKNS